jgi:hypothetical protein
MGSIETQAVGVFQKLTGYLQGRHTTFAVFFAITAALLAAFGKLTDSYALTITAIQGFVTVHSAIETHYDSKDSKG